MAPGRRDTVEKVLRSGCEDLFVSQVDVDYDGFLTEQDPFAERQE